MSLVVGPTINGMGIFAERTFLRGQVIDKIEGRVAHHSVLWKRRGTFAANCIRFGPNTYLDPTNAAGRYLNHCCVPNAGIRKWNNQLFLFARTRIARGTEVVIDYSTTLGDDDIWTMRCNCGTDSCRKTIRRFGSLPSALRRKYFEAGLVPKYILQTLDAPLNTGAAMPAKKSAKKVESPARKKVAKRTMPEFTKPTEATVKAFDDAANSLAGIERRTMFGYPSVFLNGNMLVCVFQDRIMVRLSEGDRSAAASIGGRPFEPSPGRAMKEYMELPASVVGNPKELRAWFARARKFVQALPQKKKRAK
jgi:TfoX/Sxy family transcriptional regulator of competence genes